MSLGTMQEYIEETLISGLGRSYPKWEVKRLNSINFGLPLQFVSYSFTNVDSFPIPGTSEKKNVGILTLMVHSRSENAQLLLGPVSNFVSSLFSNTDIVLDDIERLTFGEVSFTEINSTPFNGYLTTTLNIPWKRIPESEKLLLSRGVLVITEVVQGTLIVDDVSNWDILPFQKDDVTGLKLKGKNGGVAKFIFDIGPSVAGGIYTMRYSADWSLLSNSGKEAFLGFGWKEDDNDFHLVGNKGDDSTGLDIERIHGTANFNAQSGFTNISAAATNGTQSGPNWLQLEIAVNGLTYTLRSSVDGVVWNDELTAILPTPIIDAEVAPIFGIAVFLENTDKGDFEATIELWEAVPLVKISVSSLKMAAFLQPDATKVSVSSLKMAAFLQPDATKVSVSSLKAATFFTAPAIGPINDGEFAPTSGTGTAAHTTASMTSTGADTLVAITWDNSGAVRTVSSVTFNGNTMDEEHEAGRATGLNVGCALYSIAGAQSGDIVVTFDGTVDDSHITILSVDDLISFTVIDTGEAGAASGTGTTMTNLLVPGMGGIRIAVYANDTQGTGIDWTNADEQTDVDAGAHRHSVAWVEGNSDDDILADGGNDDHQLIGVSLR